jgi:Methyltransferase domain
MQEHRSPNQESISKNHPSLTNSDPISWLKLSTINHRAPYLSFITWALNVDVKLIAEIGVNQGETSKIFRELFPQAHLYLIDPWKITPEYRMSATPISYKNKHYEKAYKAVLEEFKEDPKTTVLRMSSMEALLHTPDHFDLIFIDANHEYTQVKQDILSWLPKVRPGALLAGHDYDAQIPMFSGVKRAVDEVFGNKIMLGKDRLWIHRRK